MGFAATCLELVRPRNGGAASPRIARIPLLLSDSGDSGTAVGTADLEAPAETSNLSEVGTESSDLDDPLALADLLLDPQINVRLVRGTFLRKLHQEQRPAVRRQEIEQEADALVTQDELIRCSGDTQETRPRCSQAPISVLPILFGQVEDGRRLPPEGADHWCVTRVGNDGTSGSCRAPAGHLVFGLRSDGDATAGCIGLGSEPQD